MIALGVDQAARSGWGLVRERVVVASGVALTPEDRADVIRQARELAGGDLRQLYVLLEDHSGMPLDRLGRHDHVTERRPRAGAVERSTASVIGLGVPIGRWFEQLDLAGHPQSLRDSIEPSAWRAKLGIRGHGTDELKRAACRFVSLHLGRPINDHDHAEGVCIALFAGIDGLARNEARKQEARIKARVRRETVRQGSLFDVDPANDNGSERS